MEISFFSFLSFSGLKKSNESYEREGAVVVIGVALPFLY